MFRLLWSVLTGKMIRSDGRTWPWPKAHRARKMHRYLFGLRQRLARDIEISDGDSRYRFRCETMAELGRCMKMFVKESGTCEWIKNDIGPGDVFFDIGANIGIYSILAANRVGKTGKVYAFEPHSGNFTRLLENIAVNKLELIVTPCNVALYQDEGFLLFSYFSSEAGSSHSQLFSLTDERHGPSQLHISELKYAVSIDGLIASGKFVAPNHVKIDVDGGELTILHGMDKLLRSADRPKSVQVEINKGCKQEIVTFMEGHDYELSTTHHTRHGLNLIAQGGNPEDYEYNAIFRPRGENRE